MNNNKLPLHTPDLTESNYKALTSLFPNAVTETIDANGQVIRAVDADVLAQEINTHVISGKEERYQFTWPDKKKAVLLANSPIAATLRPCREESVDFDNTENIYIEGDNLDVLKLLRETYLNRVKMIYIDPPYNTGNDFVYSDKFSVESDQWSEMSGDYDEQGNRMVRNLDSNGRFHTDWLNMIYPRLRVARDLLTDDGVIIISIDESEVHNMRKVGNEVFGEINYAGEIVWKNSSKNDQAYISIQHEYFLFYVKNKTANLGEWLEAKEGIDEILEAFNGFRKQFGDDWKQIHKSALDWYNQFPESNPIYSSKHYSWMDERGVYFPADISGPNFGQYRYDVIHPKTGKICKEPASGWRYPKTTMLDRIRDGLVHFGDDETTVPNNKTYLAETINQSLTSIKYKDGRVASKLLTTLMGTSCFTNPKDTSLLAKIFKAINILDEDIIFDFFAGSSSTAEVAMQLGVDGTKCKYILVQIQEDLDKTLKYATGSAKQVTQNAIDLCNSLNKPHFITEIGKERIRRAGESIVKSYKEQVAKKEMMKYGCIKLSKLDRLAESNGINSENLQTGKKTAKGGTLFALESDEESSGVDSVQHSRRERTADSRGISTISENSKGIGSGAGNTTSDLREDWLPCPYGYKSGDGITDRNKQNDNCPHENTENCPLVTKKIQDTSYELQDLSNLELVTSNSKLVTDVGFRVLKLDSSNMKDVYYKPQDTIADNGELQVDLDGLVDNIKHDRTPEDLLFQVMLDLGILLSSKIEKRQIGGKTVFSVADNYLVACFEHITDETVTEIAKSKPYYAVFRDGNFDSDATLVNFEQIFKTYSPATIRKVL